MLNYKNLQIKQFINDIAINLLFFRNFASMDVDTAFCTPYKLGLRSLTMLEL